MAQQVLPLQGAPGGAISEGGHRTREGLVSAEQLPGPEGWVSGLGDGENWNSCRGGRPAGGHFPQALLLQWGPNAPLAGRRQIRDFGRAEEEIGRPIVAHSEGQSEKLVLLRICGQTVQQKQSVDGRG